MARPLRELGSLFVAFTKRRAVKLGHNIFVEDTALLATAKGGSVTMLDQTRTSGTRKVPRVKVNFPLQAFKGEKPVRGWCQSLSEEGLCATLTADFKKGEVVELRLRVPEIPESVGISAFVIWRNGLEHGFEFIALPNSCRQAISRICSQCKADSAT